jgi:hypothetical protein
MCATLVLFKNLPNVNNHPMGENSPNLVTLTLQSTDANELLRCVLNIVNL